MSFVETVVSSRNTTAAPLGAGETFTGSAENLASFSELDINLAGAPANAPGTLYFEFSPDGTHWDVSVPLALAGPTMVPLPLRVVLPKFRVRYVNGATPQTEFRLTVVLHRTGLKHITRFLNQGLDDSEPIEVVRAVMAGRTAGGAYVPVLADPDGSIRVDSAGAGTEATLATVLARLTSILGQLDVALSSRATESTLASIKVKTDNLDVAASTRTKPSDQQHAVVDSSALPTGAATETTLAEIGADVDAIETSAANLDVALSTRTKPSDQQHAVVDSSALPAGAATEATLAAIKAKTDNLDVALSTRAVTGLTDAQLRATPVPVSAASLPLPAGASTEATLALIKAKTDNIDVALSTRTKPADSQHVAIDAGSNTVGKVDQGTGGSSAWKVDGSAVTQPVSGTVIANAGSGTFNNQQSNQQADYDTGAGTQNVTMFGVALPASGGAVAGGTSTNPLRTDTTGTTTQPVSAASLPLPTGAATETTLAEIGADVDAIETNLDVALSTRATETTLASRLADATFTGRINTLGQKTMANSTPVVLASDQTVVPVSDNAGSLTVDSAQLPGALVGARLDVNNGAWLGSTAPTVGSKTSANSVPVVIASDQAVVPVSDNGGSLTVDSPGVPAALGQSTMANSMRVVVASDQSAVAVSATQLPAALVGARLDTNNGAWLGSTAPTVGSKTSTNSVPVVIASDQGAVAISAASLPLPAGAATSANQTTLGNQTTKINDGTNTAAVSAANALKVDGSAVTQPISAASLPLPTGASTAALQTQPGVDIGDVTINNASGASAVNVQDGGNSLTVDSAQLPATLVGARLDTNNGAWLGSTAPTVGSKTSANSVPVVIASDQAALPDTQATGTLAAINNAVTVALAGKCGVGFLINSGSLSGSFVAEISFDNQASWQASSFYLATDNFTGSLLGVGVSLSNGLWYGSILAPQGTTHARVRVSAYSSGSTTAFITATVAGDPATILTGFDQISLTWRAPQVDSSARTLVVGAQAANAALSGNPVTVAASDGASAQIPRVFDADSGGGTQFVLGANLRRSASGGSQELLGQAAAANSLPVTIASDQGAITTQLPAALVGARLDTNNGAWLGSTAPTVGSKTSANSVPVVIASDQAVVPVSDNAGSLTVDSAQLPAALVGGRLDENVGAWLGSTAPTVGQKTMANSVPVAFASDQATFVLERATTGDPVGVTVSTSAVQVLASNASARSRIITNNGTSNVYVGRAGTVTASGAAMGVLLKPGGSYADSGEDLYTGAIFAIGDAVSASQNVSAWERT